MIDLHTHTTCSDGHYSPIELIDKAALEGVKVISITDHDTVGAYDYDVVNYGARMGVMVIPGIEFSTIDEQTGDGVHVVGLGIDVSNAYLREVCNIIDEARRSKLVATSKALISAGLKIRSEKILAENSTIAKSHLARDIIENPENEVFLRKKYGSIPMQAKVISDFLIKGAPGHVADDKQLHTSKAVDIIKNAGGKAFCAHPGLKIMYGQRNFAEIVDMILRNKFDGIEAISVLYDKNNGDTQFDMVEDFVNCALEKQLLISGGSDFHGDNDPRLGNVSLLGLSNEKYRISNDHLQKILQ